MPAEYPIILRPQQLTQARDGKRTHICLPAFWWGKSKMVASGKEERSDTKFLPPTGWERIQLGDVLWVQEEIASAYNSESPLGSRYYYRADLLSGTAPIPGGFKRGKWTQRTIGARDMCREDTRYSLHVTGIRTFPAHEIDWEEIKAEGAQHFLTDTKGQWWTRHYGFQMAWALNRTVVGIHFTFSDVNVMGVKARPVDRLSPLAIGHEAKAPRSVAAIDELFPRAEDPDAA